MERGQQIGIVISLAAEHHAIHVRELLRDLRYRSQAAICDNRECRELFFHAPDPRIVERGHFAIFLRREPLQDRLAGMHNYGTATCLA